MAATLKTVDERLERLSVLLKHEEKADRPKLLEEADRLLDLRLAIIQIREKQRLAV